MTEEVWKDIPNFEGRYMVSNLGRIKSLKYRHHNKIQILSQENEREYKRVTLYSKDGKRKWYRVHKLVAQCFILNPNNYKEINHKDEDPSNNCVDNLEWCDRSYNINYGSRNKRVALKKNKSILQFDKNNIFIKQYNSITEVTNQFDFNRSNIIACLKNRIPSAYGYKWKYADENKNRT